MTVGSVNWALLASCHGSMSLPSESAPRANIRSAHSASQTRKRTILFSYLLEFPGHGERVPPVTMKVRRALINRAVTHELHPAVRYRYHATDQQHRGDHER